MGHNAMYEMTKMLENAEQANIEDHGFIPSKKIYEIVTAENVRSVLESLIDQHMVKRTVSHVTHVTHGAHKTFAILVLVRAPEKILEFIKHIEDHGFGIDGKLPLALDVLEQYGLDKHQASLFDKRQWMFTAPIFDFEYPLPKIFTRKSILPFTDNRRLGSGGFGDVDKVEIEPQHQETPFEIVRKQFRYPRTTADYRAEFHSVSMLKTLQHPNIVQLLAAYHHRNTDNLLFPQACGGTIKDLFEKNPRPPQFVSNNALVVALAGISSALCAMHDFTTEKLTYMGCHRDLKPSNILVHEKRFILADFGLSRFKDSDENSSSDFKVGQGDYIAPECEDLDGEHFKKHKIHRSTDIWSLGCIILELLTYMIQGADGIVKFYEARKTIVPEAHFVHHRFSAGVGKPNFKVIKWHRELDNEIPSDLQRLSMLARQMLCVNQEDRPPASSVEAQLRSISIYCVSQPILNLFRDIHLTSKLLQPLMEYERFKSWLYACGLDFTGVSSKDSWTGDSFSSFEGIIQYLYKLRDQLEAIRPICEGGHRSRIFLPVIHLNDALNNLLPTNLQFRAKEHYESNMLNSNDRQLLEGWAEVRENLKLEGSLSQLARIKVMRMNMQAQKLPRPAVLKLRIDPKSFQTVRRIEAFSVVKVSDATSHDEQQLSLLEFKAYPEDCAEPKVLEILLQRLEDMASLLNKARQSDFRVLHCRGFFHDPSKFSSGLIYKFPQDVETGASLDKLTTLSHLLGQESLMKQPMLGERFAMAHGLAASLHAFHRVSWLQRRISSSNIAFFQGDQTQWDPLNFYFLGFSHSRPNEDVSYTEGPPDDVQDNYYIDPVYLTSANFRPENDYYALGIVLLEIGFWKLLGDVCPQKAMGGALFKHSKFREHVLRELVPRMGHLMGVMYGDAVHACLDVKFRKEEPLSDKPYQRFKKLVVDPLAKLVA